jgi:hypothetical protein
MSPVIARAVDFAGSTARMHGLYDGERNFCFNTARPAMTDDNLRNDASTAAAKTDKKALPKAAQRALEEAALRREEYRKREAALPKELGGRGGTEPGRYGDWEVKGLTSDF